MSQIEILCTCGHKVISRVSWASVNAGFTSRAVYYGQYNCPACAFPSLGKPSGHTTLHGLSGSTYQIAWALDIRSEHLRNFENMIRNVPDHKAKQMRADMEKLTMAQTSAGWWIDHQDNTFLPFVPCCPESIRSVIIHAAYLTKSEPERVPVRTRGA